ncbi:MAG: glycosyltransferase family 9 protein [Bryobacteraceae bacterium]|nr:glycosyltransferase family 9 protein [Bryobacteraceae bacterium]
MATVLAQLAKGAHVGIVRLRSLGDCVLTTPAIALLKRFRSDLRIGVVVEPRFAAVFEGNPDIHDVLFPDALKLRQFSPRLCLNLHGGTRSLLLTLASGAKYRAGFGHYRYSGLYNVAIPRAQEILGVDRKVHTAEHLASAMFFLGVPPEEIPRAFLPARKLKSATPYAVIHPMASSPEKAWPADRFLQLARHLFRECDLEPIFIGTPNEDLTPFRHFRVFTGPLEETKSLIASAAFFVGNDSGPAHMAAALGIPLVVMFGCSDPVVWAPWRANAESITGEGGVQSIQVADLITALDRFRVKA